MDTHCHLDNRQFAGDLDGLVARAAEAGVERMLTIGTGEGPADLDCAIKIASRYSNVYATVGVHPHDAGKADDAAFNRMRALLREEKVLAVGEIGLDYHYDFSPRPVQHEVFVRQLHLARDANKPVVIHTREAWADTISVLREHWQGGSGIFHCFTGTAEQAAEAVELGFYLGFGGVLTFPKGESVREAARHAPDDRILLETDAPFLAPVPHRGKRNEPAFTTLTAHKLAEVRSCPAEQIAAQTTHNFETLFGLPLSKPNGYTEDSDGTG